MMSFFSAAGWSRYSMPALTPTAVSWSTWSCMSEMSGELTTVTPGVSSAGSW